MESRIVAMMIAALAAAGSATAATTSSKDGLQTTTSDTSMSASSDLPILAAGIQELSVGGRLNWEDDTAYNFDISYGRFLTENWLVGVSAGITGLDSDTNLTAGIFGEYNFLTGTRWVPFIRAGIGYARPDNGDDSGTVGVDAGVKYFFRPNVAIFGSIGGDWVISGDDGGQDDGIAKQVDVGLKFYF